MPSLDSSPQTTIVDDSPDKRFVQGTYTTDELLSSLFQGKGVTIAQPEEINREIITVPKGELGAYGDWEPVTISIGDLTVDLLKQTHHNLDRGEGNCAQYSTMNAAKICYELGLKLNPLVQNHYDQHPNMDPNTVERNLIIPLLADAQEEDKLSRINLDPDRKKEIMDELHAKLERPTTSLDNVNAVLLLQEIFNPDGDIQRLIFGSEDLTRTDDFGAYLIASNGNHQQVLLVLGNTGILIDTLSPHVATGYPKDVALQNLANRLNDGTVPWSFYVPISNPS